MTLRSVLILGGSGFVGRALCETLVDRWEAGPRLRVPTRRLAHAQAVQPLPLVDVLQADVHDDAQLDRLLAGCDAVVNLVAILHGSEAAFEQVHVALPRRLAAACRRQGVRRLIHVSALGADPAGPSRYLRSKGRGEAAARGRAGPDAAAALGHLRRQRPLPQPLRPVAGPVPGPAPGRADARFQPVWVDDVAAAIATCLERPTPSADLRMRRPRGEDPGRAGAAGRPGQRPPRPILPLPGPLATLQALAMEFAPGETLMSRDNLASMTVPNVATGQHPGLADLGIAPSPLLAVVPGYLQPGQRCARLDTWRARHR
jgi:NADH dehydrogenase